jgi:DNA-binding winged helix-turn-helix (wHTH) protein
VSRPPPAADPVQLRFGEFELDEANARLLRDGQPVVLAPTPFRLLCALARQPGALLRKDQLLDTVWGHQFVSESVLKTAISDLRTALGDSPREPRLIETVSRRGYRFIGAAIAVGPVPPALPPSAPAPLPSSAFSSASEPAPAQTSTSALPPVPAAPFVGRARTLARLRHAWQRAGQGQRQLVWVAGEPGIGKTTLIEHFVAGLGPVASARGQCVEHHGTAEPYLPVLEALAERCRHDPALAPLMRRVAPTWLLQLPWLSSPDEREALRRELAGVGAERMLREMGELLDRATEQQPLLLVTEDLHWSDRATIQLIDHVARRRGPARLMWLASFRLAEVVALDHPLNALRRELRLHRLCEEMVLDPFSEIEVAEFLARRSPVLAHDEAFVRALHERTDGVPLFLSSVVSEVVEHGGDDAGAPARLAAVAVPENLAALIEHQITRLDDAQRALLAAAAVCGVEFRAETLALALQRDIGSTALACDELVRGQVWLTAPPARPYAFKHALLRQVLYERTPPALRVALHQQVGAALEQERAAGLAVASTELALHFDRGRQAMRALRHYADAAGAALQHFSPQACIDLAERAAGLLPQAAAGAERDALALSIHTLHGVAAFQALGVGSMAMGAFERAFALLDRVPEHPMRAHLLHGFGYTACMRGDYAQALAAAARAEALAKAADDPVLMIAACIVYAEVRHLQSRGAAARSWIERGLALAQSHDIASHEVFTNDPQVFLLCRLALELLRDGLVRQARAHLERAWARARALRQPTTTLFIIWQQVLFEVRLGQTERVAALADEMQQLVDEFAPAMGRTACRCWRGWAAARRGAAREAERLIIEAHEENAALGLRAGGSEVLGYAAEALLLAGDHEGARRRLAQAQAAAESLDEGVYVPQLWLLDGALQRACGQGDAGGSSVRRALDVARAQQAPWLELLALTDLCEHHDASAAERAALASLLDGLPEAADTPQVQRARSVLGAA